MPLKRHYIDFAKQTNNKVTPDEIDRYEQYVVSNPAVDAEFFAAATAGTVGQAVTFTLANVTADFPRSVAAIFSGTASVSGTATVVGEDQFGVALTESMGLAQGTQTAGTASGTQIFATISGATVAMGTGVSGNGTVSLGVPLAAGSAKFGLPAKIGGTADVKAITWSGAAGVSVALNGGTIGAYVDATVHSFVGTETLAGTMTYSVLFKPTHYKESMALMANL